MTQVKMPEPVGYLYQTGKFRTVDLKLFEDIPYNTTVKCVITTTQAEAYADARVKEALEEAEAKLMEMHRHAVKSRVPPDEDEDGWNTSCADRAIALGEAILAIRAIIPPILGREHQ